MRRTTEVLKEAGTAYPSWAPECIPCFLVGSRCSSFYLQFSPIMCLYVLSFLLWCLLWFPHKVNVQFVFASSYLLLALCVFVWSQWCPTHIVLCFCLLVFVLCTLCPFFIPHRYSLTFISFYYAVWTNAKDYTVNTPQTGVVLYICFLLLPFELEILTFFVLKSNYWRMSKQILTPLSTAITSCYLIAAKKDYIDIVVCLFPVTLVRTWNTSDVQLSSSILQIDGYCCIDVVI